ncbi:MAG: hypothetical protein ABJA02_01735 [Acidobacteriota bacterium]
MKRVIILTIFAMGMVFAAAGSMSAQSATVAGEWDASMNTPGGPRPFQLIFKVDGEKLSGTVKRSNGDVPLIGTIKGSEISFVYTISYNGHDLDLSFAGKVAGDTMGGGVSFGGNGDDEWSAKRSPLEKPKS